MAARKEPRKPSAKRATPAKPRKGRKHDNEPQVPETVDVGHPGVSDHSHDAGTVDRGRVR